MASYFHYCCDGKGPTLTVVQSEHEQIFGGYTSIPWSRSIAYHTDSSAFLFQLNRSTLHFPYRNKECAVRHHSGCLPIFGGGVGFASESDIFISDGCDKNKSSFSNLGESYSIGVRGMHYATDVSRKYLAGSDRFSVKELEIFRVIFLND